MKLLIGPTKSGFILLFWPNLLWYLTCSSYTSFLPTPQTYLAQLYIWVFALVLLCPWKCSSSRYLLTTFFSPSSIIYLIRSLPQILSQNMTVPCSSHFLPSLFYLLFFILLKTLTYYMICLCIYLLIYLPILD